MIGYGCIIPISTVTFLLYVNVASVLFAINRLTKWTVHVKKCVGSDNQRKSKQSSEPKSTPRRSSTKKSSRCNLGKRFHEGNDEDEKSPPPPKKSKSNKYHVGNACEEICVICYKTCTNPDLVMKHNMNHPYHPGDKAEEFSKYLSYNGKQIELSKESCICMPCYQDANSNYKKTREPTPIQPRWHRLIQRLENEPKLSCSSQKTDQHCTLCHQTWTDKNVASPCKSSSRTVPFTTWSKGQSVKFWNSVICSPPMNYVSTLKESSRLCQSHALDLHRIYEKKKCVICKDSKSSEWTAFSILPQRKKTSLTKANTCLEEMSVDDLKSSWVCSLCSNSSKQSTPKDSSVPKTPPNDTSESSTQEDITTNKLEMIPYLEKELKENAFARDSANFILSYLPIIRESGFVWRKQITASYNEKVLQKKFKKKEEVSTALSYFENFITKSFSKSEEFLNYKISKWEVVYFDASKHTLFSIKQVIDLEKENEKLSKKLKEIEKASLDKREIQKHLQTQTQLFVQNSNTIDYRHLQGEDQSLLQDCFYKPLFDILKDILQISSNSESHMLKLKMAVGIMCNIKNPKCVVTQTIVGLSMYSHGLRDAGFRILNKFGLSCGIKRIRKMAKKWAKKRKCIDEINKRSFWRITFDNLNFKRKNI